MTAQTLPRHKKRQPGELTGGHVLIMVIAFFAVIIAANVAFIVMAVRTFPGEDVRRSYVQGLNYNETLRARAAQQALGWQASARLDRSAGLVEITLVDAAGAPLEHASLEGALQRPLDASADRALVFENTGGGRFIAPVEALPEGQWRLRAQATRGADAFALEARLQ